MPSCRRGASCWAEMRRRPVVTWYSGFRSCASTYHLPFFSTSQLPHDGLVAVQPQDGAQRLGALPLPGQRERSRAHLGFQSIERFIVLKVAIESLPCDRRRQQQAGENDSVPSHLLFPPWSLSELCRAVGRIAQNFVDQRTIRKSPGPATEAAHLPTLPSRRGDSEGRAMTIATAPTRNGPATPPRIATDIAP